MIGDKTKFFTQESKERLKSYSNIVEVVGNYVELKKSGTQYKGLCPFHDEKTPSFFVYENEQNFHCYGCGKHGDVISFVQDYENIDFKEAVESVANQVGFELEYKEGIANDNFKEELDYFNTVNDYFVNSLKNNPEQLKYLKSRGLSDESIDSFQIGLSLNSYDFLTFLKNSKISYKVAQDMGLLSVNQKGDYYSRFTNRIIFPIKNQHGKIVAFGGRTTINAPAKYINSPQTKFYNKSETLYGYNIARKERKSSIILVEGYLDLIALHQTGFKNSVATLGTSLTEQHLKMLKKKDTSIDIMFDNDEAGKKATVKAITMFAINEVKSRVISQKKYKDFAEYLVEKEDISEVIQKIKNPMDGITALMNRNYYLAKKQNDPFLIKKAIDDNILFLNKLNPIISNGYASIFYETTGIFLNLDTVYNNSPQPNIKKIENEVEYTQAEFQIYKTVLENENLLGENREKLSMFPKLKKILENTETKDTFRSLCPNYITALNEESFNIALNRFIIQRLKREIIEAKRQGDYIKAAQLKIKIRTLE
jgi:DNA primase